MTVVALRAQRLGRPATRSASGPMPAPRTLAPTSVGAPISLHKLEREEEHRLRYREPERQVPDPCRDGRYSEGRPATCAELRKRPRREVREGRAEREGRGERQLSPG
jgi:hypothetical protein